MTTITTRHGVLRVHAHWMDTPEACYQRWLKAGAMNEPVRMPAYNRSWAQP